MIEFAAVIEEILVNQTATTMRLDVSIQDVTPLSNLIDQAVTVTITPATPSRGTASTQEKTKRKTQTSERTNE